jgi:hypothetical protein
MKSQPHLVHWLLGFAFGALAGGFILEAGVLALLLLAPVLLWCWREAYRPLGLAGLVTGIGSGWAVLLGWADQRCRLDPSCSMPDQTGYFAVAGVLILAGAFVTFLARGRRATGGA